MRYARWYYLGVDPTAKGGRPRTKRGPRGKFAEDLRAARWARGMSQAQAAADLGILQPVFARWESGARKPSGLALRYMTEVWIPNAPRGAINRGEA